MKQNIILFGFSGSGKTTLSKELAKKLSMQVIHPSIILQKIIIEKEEYREDSLDFWLTHNGKKYLKERKGKKLDYDFICDDIILSQLNLGNTVVGSWSMPWIDKDAFKVYLLCDKKTRILRVMQRCKISYTQARYIVHLKDSSTRELYLDKFDIMKDHNIFNYIVDANFLSIDVICTMIIQAYNRQNVI